MSAPASLAFCRIVALGEHGDAHGFADTVRQHDGAAHHLVGFTRIDAEVHGDVDGLVELGGGGLLTSASASASG